MARVRVRVRVTSPACPNPEPTQVHDAPAHAAAPLAADCFSVGALLLEVLTGKTPRWNQARPAQTMARTHALHVHTRNPREPRACF